MTFITIILRHKYGDKAKLLFTDTNSLAYDIKTKDFYKDINPDIEKQFNNSDHRTNHPSYIKTGLNSKVLAMFKDEAGGNQIVEVVGLRANEIFVLLDTFGSFAGALSRNVCLNCKK